MTTERDVVAIGASAGGVQALTALVSGLPGEFPATVLVTLHLAARSSSNLPAILAQAGPLGAAFARTGDRLVPGRILVAPPDHHLWVSDGAVELHVGPRENGFRPAVDVMFRSVAAARGRRAIGVVLSGTRDDGAAGLLALRRAGGLAVVQDPADATFPDMPLAAVEVAGADHVVAVRDIPALLGRLVAERPPAAIPRQRVEETMRSESPYTCPECGGVLWETAGTGAGFRCRVGHAYGPGALLAEQAEHVDMALWAGLRALEENVSLSRRLAERARQRGAEATARRFDERAEEQEERARVLRDLLHVEADRLTAPGEEPEPDRVATRQARGN